MKTYLLVLFVVALALSACSAGESSASLISSWKLVSYGPPDAPITAVPDTEAGVIFNEDGTLTGHSGCNGFGGKYTVERDQVTFSEVVSTLMACEEPRMSQENVVHRVLTDNATYKIEDDTLTLTNNGMVLILTR